MRWFLNKQRSIGCKNCFTPPVKKKINSSLFFFLRWLLCHPVYRENSFWDQLEIKSSTQNSWNRDQKNKRGVDAHVLLVMILVPWQSLQILHRLIMAILRISFKRDTCCVSSHWAFIHFESDLLHHWGGVQAHQIDKSLLYMYWQFFSEMMCSFLSE